MSLSASKMKHGGLTTLELQAQNIAKEDDSDDNVQVTDEAKYNALVESRKSRRAVSLKYFTAITTAMVCNFTTSLSVST